MSTSGAHHVSVHLYILVELNQQNTHQYFLHYPDQESERSKKMKQCTAIGNGLSVLLLLLTAIVTARGSGYEYDDDLSYSHYHGSCPNMEKIVHHKLHKWLKNDSTLAPALMRLHFHDCSVRVRTLT